jgi:hypothetical protein
VSVHYPPSDVPTFSINEGEVFQRWSSISRCMDTLRVLSVNPATELFRVSIESYGRKYVCIRSMTEIRQQYTHGGIIERRSS